MKGEINKLAKQIENLCNERQWGIYHTPKNIAVRLSIESSELLEIFNWKNEEQSKYLDEKERRKVINEIGDITYNLINFCSKLGLDPIECCKQKLEEIEKKYPVNKFKGKANKYNEL